MLTKPQSNYPTARRVEQVDECRGVLIKDPYRPSASRTYFSSLTYHAFIARRRP